MRRTPVSGLLAVLALAVFVGACGREPTDSQTEVPKVAAGTPIVLISIDTLRADRLPAYGYPGVETPGIDALRTDSILFESAYSHVPLTLPSHISLLTGLLPTEHKVRDNLGSRLESADDVPYLPRRLKELGYATGAAISSVVLNRKAGLAPYFDLYDDTLDKASQTVRVFRAGLETLEPAKAWIDSVADQPFFLFFHIYDPHTPRDPVEPYASQYARPYDAEVAYSDQVIGDLLAHLKSHGLYDKAIVILTSDHGEGLGDHGEFEHGVFLYTATQQIPLLLKLPDNQLADTTVERPVGLIDIYPTVMELLGEKPEAELAGVSLLADGVDPDRTVYAETFYARAHFGWSELTSLIGGRYQYIDAPRPELYDLSEDPAQTTNLIQTERRVAAQLRQELESFDRTYTPPAEVNDETREQLAALGYVGNVVETGDGPLRDPKDRVRFLGLLKTANMKFHQQDFDGAVEAFREVVASEPGMVDAWETLAKALMRSGRLQEALDVYREALELSGGDPKMALSVAGLLVNMKRLDEAESHAKLAIGSEKTMVTQEGDQAGVASVEQSAVTLLGEIAVRKGEIAQAEEYLARAVELEVAPLQMNRLAASIALAREEFQKAIDLTDEAVALLEGSTHRRPLRGIFLISGQAHVQLGQTAEAEAAFLKEIDVDPSQLQPYAHLALLYAVQNRGPDVGRTLQRMVETNPTPTAYGEAVRTLHYIGDDRAAAAVLRQALSRWPNDPQLRELVSG